MIIVIAEGSGLTVLVMTCIYRYTRLFKRACVNFRIKIDKITKRKYRLANCYSLLANIYYLSLNENLPQKNRVCTSTLKPQIRLKRPKLNSYFFIPKFHSYFVNVSQIMLIIRQYFCLYIGV